MEFIVRKLCEFFLFCVNKLGYDFSIGLLCVFFLLFVLYVFKSGNN